MGQRHLDDVIRIRGGFRGPIPVSPKPPLWGDPGLLRFARDLLIMAVPFMIGALAAVSMGAPGEHLDRRPLGVEIMLANDVLTLLKK
jgi:hypothetical protein